MFLRKLFAVLCPFLVVAAVCALFRWVDGWLGATAYAAYVLKGSILGAALAFMLPIAGVRAFTNGLCGWLLAGAVLMGAVLVYQYLETAGAVNVPLLRALLTINGQVVLVESAAMGYLAAAGFWYRKR